MGKDKNTSAWQIGSLRQIFVISRVYYLYYMAIHLGHYIIEKCYIDPRYLTSELANKNWTRKWKKCT